MGKPYSVDLRKRVVAAIEAGMSRNQAAQAVWGRDQHGDWLDAADGADRERCSRSDGRSQAEGDFGRAGGLVIAADQSW